MGGNKDKAAALFADILKNDRAKRKNEEIANQMLGGGARKTTGAGGGGAAMKDRRTGNGPSLASRMGVAKPSQRATSTGSRSGMGSRTTSERSIDTPSNTNTNARLSRVTNLPRTASESRLDRKHRLYEDLVANQTAERSREQAIFRRAAAAVTAIVASPIGDISVRGMGGPYTVVASNFAPGTTAADIEAVIAPVGGELVNCRLVASNPTVIAEMVFVDKAGAENVIATFNNKKADGRTLYVYMKDPVASQRAAVQQKAQQQQQQTQQAPRSRVATPQLQQPQQQYTAEEDDTMMVEDEEVETYAQSNVQEQDSPQPNRAQPSYQDGSHGFAEENTAQAPPQQYHHTQQQQQQPPQQPAAQREENTVPPPISHQPHQPHQQQGSTWRNDNRRNEWRGDYRRDTMRRDDQRWDDRRYDRRDRMGGGQQQGRLYSDGMFQSQRGRDQRYRG